MNMRFFPRFRKVARFIIGSFALLILATILLGIAIVFGNVTEMPGERF